MTSLIEHILSLSGWVALLIVFAVPALEASVFLGFVFPGETALILGGVLASYGRVTLWAVFLAGISGAVIGDSVGYLVGREYGARMLQATRFHRLVKPHRIERAQDYPARRAAGQCLRPVHRRPARPGPGPGLLMARILPGFPALQRGMVRSGARR
jgi:undecaprenyl-diphosphatase